ncbi:uncharacterized protein CPAR2_602460 [Candida parapsilosis]|uniref:Uncharacterized protein n=1 Tax=Candida parapsilosis (strain CDC 317 / ATCC MYA-4646) TaxID=578454 RepID=G8B5D6_CANPC|nr:uncharacterized protein CPAR2_602460 [Candida parapsilosis]CCE39828.1 hypothetical protein CPAR2_602460 [Candida parapsilosis]
MLHRTRSQETLSTLINDRIASTSSSVDGPTTHHQNANEEEEAAAAAAAAADVNDTDSTFDSSSDLISYISQETLIPPQMRILNHAITDFHVIKEIPILSCYLQTGVHLYPSWSATSRNQPILTRPSKFINNIFRLNSPFLVIESYAKSARAKAGTNANINVKTNVKTNDVATSNVPPPPAKEVFCRVDFKIQSTRITYYVLTFPTLNKCIYLINNNSHSPSVDFELDGTHFRAIGVTGTTSALGTSGLIKLYVMENSPDLLTFDTSFDYKRKKLTFGSQNQLSKLIDGQNRAAIDESMKRARKLINMPVAQYLDQGDVKFKIEHSSMSAGESNGAPQHSHSHHHHLGGGKNANSFIKHGVIKMFDYEGGNGGGSSDEDKDVMSQEMMMICCVLLVLREQEYRKYKGDKKPQYV